MSIKDHWRVMTTSYFLSPEVTPLRKMTFCSENRKPDRHWGMCTCFWRECCQPGTRPSGSQWIHGVPGRRVALGPECGALQQSWEFPQKSLLHWRCHSSEQGQLEWGGWHWIRTQLEQDHARGQVCWRQQGWSQQQELYQDSGLSL